MMSVMHHEEAKWVLGIDFAFVDRRFGAANVNRLLEDGRDYTDAPLVDGAGRVGASLVSADGGTALRVRLRDEALEVTCACSRGRPYVCEHVTRVLVDLAVHPRLREALAVASLPPPGLVEELPVLRAAAVEERTLDERLARWLPSRAFEEDLEIDVEVVRTAGLATTDERPALVLRHRRAGARTLVRPREVQGARLSPRHRRLVELTAPGHTDRNVLVSTRAQASMLLQLLREEAPIFTRDWKSRLRFSSLLVAPRLERSGERLVARWYASDGRAVADAADTLLFTGPFPYLWSEAHEIFHPVSSDVDLDMAWGISRVPSLPLSSGSAEKIGRALLTWGRGLGVAVPPPETFGLPPFEAPSFELALEGSPLDVRGKLFAVYRAGKLRVEPNARDAGGRDLEAEERALALVNQAGLVSDPDRPGADTHATEEHAVHLWQHGIQVLRSSTSPSIAIVVSDALARVKVGPPVDVHVSVGEASGWLDVELEFRAGALSVELARLRAALASKGKWIALSDGTLAELSDRVRALIDETAALADDHGRARLAPHHLGRVERWIEDFGGSADDRISTLRSRLRALAVDADARIPSGLDATLRPYQVQGLAWLQFLRELGAGGVLADDMGLGKTITTLAFLARLREDGSAGPSLVVCPTSVVGNWMREAKRFVPQLRVLVLYGGGRNAKTERIAESDLVVTTYPVLRRDIDRLAHVRLRCAIFDEAQNVKNAGTATTRAARRILADMRLALSGTPIENRLTELWSIMNVVNPGMLGSRAEFDERFATPIANAPSGVAAADLRALVRPFVLRRTKADVLLDLPPKTEVDRACVLGLRQKRLYDALALTLREAVKKDEGRRGHALSRLSVLTAILRLRQMACDPRLVDATVPSGESTKRAAFLELVRELVAEGRRALVFSQFVELFTLWREDLDREKIAYEYLDGASTNRDAIVERFQNGDAPLFLVSLKAGGAGLNLTAADTVIHCDPWWNPAVEDQATDRAHRMGQARPVTVVRLVAMGTIEEKIGVLSSKKRELADAVMGSDTSETALRGLTDGDVELLLGALPTPVGVEGSSDIDGEVAVTRRFVAAREVDELRAILRRVESSGTPRKDLARRVGLPVARVALLLIGHRVPISTKSAEKIRALALPT
jgi:superfamily II DNA or RNA helicase